MQEIAYVVQGFLTVRSSPLRVPLNGSLAVRADPGSGAFTGDLVLDPSIVSWGVRGGTLLRLTVQITAESQAAGQVDHEGRLSAMVSVDAVIADARVAGRRLISGNSCRTASHAIVPLGWEPGFDLGRGGRLRGTTTGRRSPNAGGSPHWST